jgi:hypothetical protein
MYPGVVRHMEVEKSRGRAIAQAPEYHSLNARLLLQQRADRCRDVVGDRLEVAVAACTVPHAAIVEAQHWIPSFCESSRKGYELSVAACAILWTTNDHDDASMGRCVPDVRCAIFVLQMRQRKDAD